MDSRSLAQASVSEMSSPDEAAVPCAHKVAALLAVDPAGLGGAVLRAPAGPLRDSWLDCLRAAWPLDAPVRRLPLHANEEQLGGGLDLSASLRQGRPVLQSGWLARVDGGLAIAVSAERLDMLVAARLAQALDTGETRLERHGLTATHATRFALVALDEGAGDDEQVPMVLRERLAFHLLADVPVEPAKTAIACSPLPQTVAAARRLLPQVRIGDDLVQSLCVVAMALGVVSLRASLMAVRAARALAALDGRVVVMPADCGLAASLVLAPRACRIPPNAAQSQELQKGHEEQEEQKEPQDAQASQDDEQDPASADAPQAPEASAPPSASEQADAAREPSLQPTDAQASADDVVLQAARAAIPAGLLSSLMLGPRRDGRSQSRQGAGARSDSRKRGRPAGVRRGPPGSGARVHVAATLRAAAPWQALRRAQWAQAAAQAIGATAPHVFVRREDFHVSRFKQRQETTTIFAVDASGSAALHRLAEAKGAVELLLAECYVRRDRVAVLAFRGRQAQVLLPPTRSLVRARRSLAGLPGGGGTPLAAGLDGVRELASVSAARGETPLIVLLTDGRANIARDGSPGRARAMEDAMAAARLIGVEGWASLLLDTSSQPQGSAQQLSAAMGASYLPLPHAGAVAMSQAVSRFKGAIGPAQ